jgi:hypothetical protein
MVEVVAGKGQGLHDTSLDTIGPTGVLSRSACGQGFGRAFVNAVNGNLVLQARDAELAGRGSDLFATRTYNSQAADGGAGAVSWRWGYVQEVRFEGPGTPDQPDAGAVVVRTHADGHETRHEWDPQRSVFVAAEGSRARDTLRYDTDAREWVWTDGATRLVERYANSTGPQMPEHLLRATDVHGSSIVLGYDDDRSTFVRDEGAGKSCDWSTPSSAVGFSPVGWRFEPWSTTTTEIRPGTLGDPTRVVEYGYDSVTGAVTRLERNPCGRVVRQTQYANRADPTAHRTALSAPIQLQVITAVASW